MGVMEYQRLKPLVVFSNRPPEGLGTLRRAEGHSVRAASHPFCDGAQDEHRSLPPRRFREENGNVIA